MKDYSASPAELETLLDPRTIAKRAALVAARALKGETHFQVNTKKLDEVATMVADESRRNYPDLKIPFHSRWRHFQAAGADRLGILQKTLAPLSPDEQVRAKLDLVIVSVLLDAGAGMAWYYSDKRSGQKIGRSEGLAVASFEAFLEGAFSSDPKHPHRVDAAALKMLRPEKLAQLFQVTAQNPLAGLEGRARLMRALGETIDKTRTVFWQGQRPSDLLDGFDKRHGQEATAREVLRLLQDGLGAMWPGRVSLNGVGLGDVWPYAPLGEGTDGLLPFHKLSQWLTYSIVDPLQEAGCVITNFEELSALAEYRNGGLLVDSGFLELRNPALITQEHDVSSELVLEWRALTVHFLGELAPLVRKLLDKTEAELPLGKILEGGTWSAGRRLAQSKRADGGSPIKVKSDGTVF